MRVIMESIFDAGYLISVLFIGLNILKNSKTKESKLFGIMSVILVCGDAFHLVPRIYALNTNGLENYVEALGLGTLVASISMTLFYLLLYFIWKIHYKIKSVKTLDSVVYMLVFLRLLLCQFPQNMWFSSDSPFSWSIYRNVPFIILGIIMIVIFYKQSRSNSKDAFYNVWLAILLSFAFYLPVVLFAGINPLFGMFMIPKTIMYVWIVVIGYKNMKIKG